MLYVSINSTSNPPTRVEKDSILCRPTILRRVKEPYFAHTHEGIWHFDYHLPLRQETLSPSKIVNKISVRGMIVLLNGFFYKGADVI